MLKFGESLKRKRLILRSVYYIRAGFDAVRVRLKMLRNAYPPSVVTVRVINNAYDRIFIPGPRFKMLFVGLDFILF
jgi:hypothetical protein